MGHHFSGVKTSLSATTGGNCKASVLEKLHDHSYHVYVRQEYKQVAGEATVLAVSLAAVRFTNADSDFLFALKESSMFWINKTA